MSRVRLTPRPHVIGATRDRCGNLRGSAGHLLGKCGSLHFIVGPTRRSVRGLVRGHMLTATSASDERVHLERLVGIYRTVVTIRFAELRIRAHVETEGFGGFWHPGIGQEAVQVGAVAAMQP